MGGWFEGRCVGGKCSAAPCLPCAVGVWVAGMQQQGRRASRSASASRQKGRQASAGRQKGRHPTAPHPRAQLARTHTPPPRARTLLGSHSPSSRQRWCARWISSASTLSSTWDKEGQGGGRHGGRWDRLSRQHVEQQQPHTLLPSPPPHAARVHTRMHSHTVEEQKMEEFEEFEQPASCTTATPSLHTHTLLAPPSCCRCACGG